MKNIIQNKDFLVGQKFESPSGTKFMVIKKTKNQITIRNLDTNKIHKQPCALYFHGKLI